MNPRDAQRILDGIIEVLEEMLQNGEVLPDEFLDMLNEEMEFLAQEAQQQPTQPEPEPEPPTQQNPYQGQTGPINPPVQGLGPPPSPEAQLLWILAGQQEDAFINYLRNYPSQNTRELLSNPAELERIIQYLHVMMPSQTPENIDGFNKTELNSSHVWGADYDPSTRKMAVRFNDGSIIEYDKVPPNIYNAVVGGKSSAKTTGQNQWGRWWKGKNPSIGAALNRYLKQGGFNSRRVK